MERKKTDSPRASESDAKSRLKDISINRFIGAEKRLPGSIRFLTLGNTPDFSAVFILGRSYGFCLFFATTQNEADTYYKQTGKTIVESPTEMIIDCQEISDQKINERLPAFLQEYYPNLAENLPTERQIITPRYPIRRLLASQARQRP